MHLSPQKEVARLGEFDFAPSQAQGKGHRANAKQELPRDTGPISADPTVKPTLTAHQLNTAHEHAGRTPPSSRSSQWDMDPPPPLRGCEDASQSLNNECHHKDKTAKICERPGLREIVIGIADPEFTRRQEPYTADKTV